MIEKMKYVNIMGGMNDIDRVIEHYISNYEIQLEYTLKEVVNTSRLEPCYEQNPYAKHLEKAEKFANIIGMDKDHLAKDMEKEEALEIIHKVSDFFDKRDESLKELELRTEKLSNLQEDLEPFKEMDFNINNLKEFRFIKYRFGRMPMGNFRQFESYVYSQRDILFVEGKRTENHIYGAYFVPITSKDRIDTLLSSLNFERTLVPFEIESMEINATPYGAYEMLSAKIKELKEEISKQQGETIFALGINKQDIVDAYYKIKSLYQSYEIRKYAAKMRNGFYIFVGWMPEKQANKLSDVLNEDRKVIFIIEDEAGSVRSIPPTKLANFSLFRPFEFFVRTYGVPKYTEMDPTPFVAITYFFLFGMMFGDLGQGAVLSLLGLYLYKGKKLELGAIMGLIGLSSMFFGLMYGSVFGIEHLIPALWMRPFENMMDILVIAVGLGVGLIFIAMIFNMINAIKEKDLPRLLLGPNGLTGLIFYGAVIGIAISFVRGATTVATWLIILFIVIPLILIAFREPIGDFLKKKKRETAHGGGPMFLLETIIELFEVLLTYFTNTVSFVRVGAFALSHAGMMSVVLLMAQNGTGGYNLVVMILGNILVMAMEGLVVGIQVLRIEFYELFSRYYEGGGREFKATSKNNI